MISIQLGPPQYGEARFRDGHRTPHTVFQLFIDGTAVGQLVAYGCLISDIVPAGQSGNNCRLWLLPSVPSVPVPHQPH